MGTRNRKRIAEPTVVNPVEEDETPASKRVKNGETDKENAVNGAKIRSVNKPGKPPEAGVIKTVYVENFMCHRKYTAELCRNVNFINGQNGSGKSAILAAIQICLGAGARRTHRARNLKELIRKEAGATTAKVRVTLLNGGDDAFQRDVYGDTITVERSISKSGGYNGYKLIGQDGKEKSRSKKDLDNMLDQLNIQVENPVAVLDQEEAKKFLTGKPEDKFHFFMKATELERMDKTYDAVLDDIEEMSQSNDRSRNAIKADADKVKELHHECKQFQELEKLEEKVDQHHVEYSWALFNEVDEETSKLQSNVATLTEKREKRQKDLQKEIEENVSGDDEEQKKKDRMAELTEEAKEAAKSKTNLEAELKHASAPIKAKERELATLKREKSRAAKNLIAAKKDLQEARDQIVASAGSAKTEEARRAKILASTEKQLDDAKSAGLQVRQNISESLRRYEELEPHVEQAKSNTSSLSRQHGAVQHKIRDLQSSENSSVSMFGQKCAAVLKLVQRSKRQLRGKVIGPIGAHIKIMPGKENFAALAEHAIGNNTLGSFIVTENADRQLLQKFRRDSGCSSHECGLIQVADVPRFQVPDPPTDGIETVASVLQIEDALVFNCLVDSCAADKKALAPSKETSERALLIEDANQKYKIRGGLISTVYFLPNGDNWSVNKKGLRQIVSNERRMKQTIGVDKSRAIEQAKAELEQLKKDRDDCRAKETDLVKQYKEQKIKWNDHNRALRENTKLIEELENTIEEVKAEAESAQDSDLLDTSELEDDVRNAEEGVDHLSQQTGELQHEIEVLKPKVDEICSRLEEVSARNEKVLVDLEKAEEELNQHYQNLSQRQALVTKKQTKLEEVEQALQDYKEKLEETAEQREKALFHAKLKTFQVNERRRKKEENGAPEENLSIIPQGEEASDVPDELLEDIKVIRTNKEPQYYRNRAERLKKKIAEEKERRRLSEVDPAVAKEKYVRAQNALNEKVSKIEETEQKIEDLMEDLKSRKTKWNGFRKHIEIMTNDTFDEMLNKKGSSGELVFDHASNTLDLRVQKDNMNEMSQTNDVKALSGGERSFTTLSLLLALGEQLETPFRVMDEFDVFLDPQARKIALDTLVEVSKSMEHRQFIFITPQDLSTLKTDPMLKLIKMNPPARSGNVGGPIQRTLDFESSD